MQQQAQQPVQAKPAITQKPAVTVQAQQKPVVGKTTQPVAQPGQAIQPVKKSSKWWLWLIVILVSAGVGFVAGYFII